MRKPKRNRNVPVTSGLKEHTHAERATILKELVVPTLRKELGKNLLAIAADGSFARHEDAAYSDLELMVFVRNKEGLPIGFSKIHDGLLIEGLFVTEKEFHDMVHEPNESWYIAGSDRLLAITNPGFVKKVGHYRMKERKRKFDKAVRGTLFEVQESFGKLFNAIGQRNRENLSVLFSEAVIAVLKFASFINERPYTSSRMFISEARAFRNRPHGFDEFLDLAVEARYLEWNRLHRTATTLFKGIEAYLRKRWRGKLYDDDLSTILRKTKETKRR